MFLKEHKIKSLLCVDTDAKNMGLNNNDLKLREDVSCLGLKGTVGGRIFELFSEAELIKEIFKTSCDLGAAF